jgi:hypothetical protein
MLTIRDAKSSNLSARIYNIRGEVVRTYTSFQAPSLIIQKGNLTNGFYLLELEEYNQLKAYAKFLIVD